MIDEGLMIKETVFEYYIFMSPLSSLSLLSASKVSYSSFCQLFSVFQAQGVSALIGVYRRLFELNHPILCAVS